MADTRSGATSTSRDALPHQLALGGPSRRRGLTNSLTISPADRESANPLRPPAPLYMSSMFVPSAYLRSASLTGQHRFSRAALWGTAAARPRYTEKRAVRVVASWHEAAHAVVGVRLGMTLHSVDIRLLPRRDDHGNVSVSCGYTSYVVSDLTARLGEPAARRARAIFAAAGIVAERAHGDGDPTACTDDVDGVMRHGTAAGVLPVEMATFLADAVTEASRLLMVDGGAAWLRVRTALLRQRSLSPARVVARWAVTFYSAVARASHHFDSLRQWRPTCVRSTGTPGKNCHLSPVVDVAAAPASWSYSVAAVSRLWNFRRSYTEAVPSASTMACRCAHTATPF